MNVNKHTADAPEPNTAYYFNIPTGGIAANGSRLYRCWTQDVVFRGDWSAASEFGVIRSVQGRGADPNHWPSNRAFRYPENVFAPTDDPKGDALIRVYARNLKTLLETRSITPSLSLEECRVRAAKAAQRELGDEADS